MTPNGLTILTDMFERQLGEHRTEVREDLREIRDENRRDHATVLCALDKLAKDVNGVGVRVADVEQRDHIDDKLSTQRTQIVRRLGAIVVGAGAVIAAANTLLDRL